MGTADPRTGPTIDGHVPVEHRWHGLDRRGILPAAVVLAIIVVMTAVLPAIDDAVAWDDPVAAGDVITLGQGITVVPPVGWELLEGIRVGREPTVGVSSTGASAVVSDGGVTISVARSGFDGTADDLLRQEDRILDRSGDHDDLGFQVTAPRQTVTTSSGLTGVSEAFTSATDDGRLVAFAFDAGLDGATPTGVTVTVRGPSDRITERAAEIDAVIASLAYEEPAP